MRETRLYSFALPGVFNTAPAVQISVPTTTTPPSPEATWAGLALGTIAWRVEQHASSIVLEHIISRVALRLNLSSPLAVRPLLQPASSSPDAALSLQLICHAHDSSSTFVHLHITRSLRAAPGLPPVTERSRQFLSAKRVTAVLPSPFAPTDVALGLLDGRVALLGSDSPTPQLEPVSAPPDRSQTTDSRLSVMSRLFTTSTQPAAVGDAVVALAATSENPALLAALHASARVTLYTPNNDTLSFMADTRLPATLASAATHALHPGPSGSVVAVVRTDEDPRPDALRVFAIRPSRSGPSVVSLASRAGPTPRVAGVARAGDAVIVALDDGGLWPVVVAASAPQRSVWSASAELDRPFGLARALDTAVASPRERLLLAHRIPARAIARALRLQDGDYPRANIATALTPSNNEEDDEETRTQLSRVLTRAEQGARTLELRVRDVAVDSSLGSVVVARGDGLFVLRRMSAAERVVAAREGEPLDCGEEVKGPAAWLLASHAACQELGARFLREAAAGHGTETLSFMLRMATSFSERVPHEPLTDLLVRNGLENSLERGSRTSLSDATGVLCSTLEPGTSLLSTLFWSNEMVALEEAANMSLNLVQVSASFALGMVLLDRHKREVALLTAESGLDIPPAEGEMTDASVPPSTLDKAFALLVRAAELCYEGDTRPEYDISCALGIAGVTKAVDTNSTRILLAPKGNISNIPSSGLDEPPAIADAGFWLLERAVRYLESSAHPGRAAAAALEAMNYAPDKQKHEMMRAAAFNRFLDAGMLELALKALLSEPYQDDQEADLNVDEAAALRDAIGLYVNTVADRNELDWLAKQVLPEPLYVLCAQALERRARAAEAFKMSSRPTTSEMPAKPIELEADLAELVERERPVSEYEQLFSWLVTRGDHASAASCALEWAERLSREGLATIRAVDGNRNFKSLMSAEMFMSLLVVWAKTKCDALACALAATQLMPPDSRYIVRSRFSLVALEAENIDSEADAVIDISWLSRRHLLAHAQWKHLMTILNDCQAGILALDNVRHLTTDGSHFLTETRAGVHYVASMLAKIATHDALLLCVEMCAAWRREIGDSVLIDAVRAAAAAAARREIDTFDYPQLDALLKTVNSFGDDDRGTRNWHLIALESALSACAGMVSCPQWLVDAAAWAGAPTFVRTKGDPAAVARAFIRNNRPVDAADVLLAGLATLARSTEPGVCVPYTAVDATLEALMQVHDDFSAAADRHKRLLEAGKLHIERTAARAETGRKPAVQVGNEISPFFSGRPQTPVGRDAVMEIA